MNVSYNNELFNIELDGSPFRPSETIVSSDGSVIITADHRNGIYNVTIGSNKPTILRRICQHLAFSFFVMVMVICLLNYNKHHDNINKNY